MSIIVPDKKSLKEIPGFPNYFITKNGEVWSKPRKRVHGGWLKHIINKTGHHLVSLRRDNKTHITLVHRIVLEVFIGSCPDKMEGCHNNGQPGNNNVSNLRWDTHKNNQHDMKKHGTYSPPPVSKGEKNIHNKLTQEQVKDIIKLYDKGTHTQTELASLFSVDRTTISKIITKVNWRHLWN